MTQRSGCRQSFCNRLFNSPDELDAMTTSGSRRAANRANKARFNSSRSGALSWTNSAPARAASGSVWKVSAVQGGSAGSGDSRARIGQAAPTNSCRKVSAPGAGSVAATVSPRAKNTAVQLAPIVPVPIVATRLILSPAMSVSSRRPALAEPRACVLSLNYPLFRLTRAELSRSSPRHRGGTCGDAGQRSATPGGAH